MIKKAYREGDLRFVRQDEHGNDQCVGLGGTGIWERWASRPSKPIDGQRYASPYSPSAASCSRRSKTGSGPAPST